MCARIVCMQEILARPDDECRPPAEREFYELRIDEQYPADPRYYVFATKIRWDEETNGPFFENEQIERFETYDEASRFYETRRSALMQLGFTVSGMDLF